MFPITITTKITEDVYYRFALYSQLRRKWIWSYFGVIACILLIIGLIDWLAGNPFTLLIFLLLYLAVIGIFFLTWYLMLKNRYRKTPVMQNIEQTLIFNQDNFLSKTNRGETTYYYEEITSVIETKRDIYLMLGKNLGIPIEKAKCTPQAIEFLRTLKSPA